MLGSTSPIRSSGMLCLCATLIKEHCSACVFPSSSREYPVDNISFLSASTRTAPTQNLVEDGGKRRAFSRAYSMYPLWSSRGIVGYDRSDAVVGKLLLFTV